MLVGYSIQNILCSLLIAQKITL